MNRYPTPKIDHLIRLTDDTGMIQHAAYSLPDRDSGYATDDNARALVVTLALEEAGIQGVVPLIEVYMAYLKHSQLADGRFHNLMDYSRRFVDDVGSEDCLGRCLWASGRATMSQNPAIRLNGERLFDGALPWCERLKAPRARAQAIMGLRFRLLSLGSEEGQEASTIRGVMQVLADSLVREKEWYSQPQWHWYEDILAYDNGLLPASLFAAYRELKDGRYLQCGQETLAFLTGQTWRGRYFKTVGNRGWYKKGHVMAEYDEQPVDMGTLVLACGEAYHATGEERYYRLAHMAFQWFLGRNSAGQALYDERTGGCHDGITPEGVNLNMGAESVLAFFIAYLSLLECAKRRHHVAA